MRYSHQTWSAMRVICPAKTLSCALAPPSSAAAPRTARRTSASRCSAVAASASNARASASAAAMRASSSCTMAAVCTAEEVTRLCDSLVDVSSQMLIYQPPWLSETGVEVATHP